MSQIIPNSSTGWVSWIVRMGTTAPRSGWISLITCSMSILKWNDQLDVGGCPRRSAWAGSSRKREAEEAGHGQTTKR